MLTAIYQMEFLAEDDAAYTGYFHNLDEAREHFREKHPGQDFEVWFAGGIPQYFTLKEWRTAVRLFGEKNARQLDELCATDGDIVVFLQGLYNRADLRSDK